MPKKWPADESVGVLLHQLIDDGRAFVRTQIALYRAILTERATDAGIGLAFGFAALALAQAAIVGIIIGLILTLAPHIGPGFATLAVVGGTLVIVAVLGWLCAGRMKRAIAGEPE